MRAALLAALLVSPSFAADAPRPDRPLTLLIDSFGQPGIDTLAARGVIVLQGKPGARRLAAVHWKSFSALAGAASSCLALASASDVLGHEPEPSSPSLDLNACRALPMDGMMTPSLHALASALEAVHEESWALHLASAQPRGTPGRPNIFDTAWGKELIERSHADALENPASLTRSLFENLLAGPRADNAAAALFAAEAGDRGVPAPDKLISEDALRGKMSPELRAQLSRTLSNERRRWAAEKARAAASDLLGKASVKRELEELRGASKALAANPNLLAALEAALSRSELSPEGARIRSAGLHRGEPTRLGQHELGDEVVVSGAYWVDGLQERESIEVSESIAIETDRGFTILEARTHKRRNGGPYAYAHAFKIAETRSFGARALISADDSSLIDEHVEIPVARDFELALSKEAEAAGLRASCRMRDAEAAFDGLEALVAEPAKFKPQYKELAKRAAKAKSAAKTDAETRVKLEEALAQARADSAPQLCRYETKHAEEALKLLKRLPPGCDQTLPELHALHATITRRAVDQKWFMKASAEARRKFKSCDLEAARARWSEAFAVLDADPGARCGRVEEEEGRAKSDFAELAREIAWREALQKSLARAETETSPARRLEILHPITARLGFLDDKCLGPESRRAASLAKTASKELTAPADNELTRRLPADNALAATVADIRADRARRLEAATASERAASESSGTHAEKTPEAEASSSKSPTKRKAVRLKKKGAKQK